jgi:uncharacterized protein (DUF934 family)
MSVIVTDQGFGPETRVAAFLTLEELRLSETAGHVLDLAPDSDPEALAPFLDRLALIRIAFPAFSDGRGFSIASRLRLMGYRGRLRARGHVLADQYGHARRAGFDEVEIDASLAARQPEDQWLRRANWQDGDYRNRLRQKPAAA